MTINDMPVGRSVDETLRLVQAFQYTDKHGEGTVFAVRFPTTIALLLVCPAGWKPGDDTIKPKDAKEYFSKQN